MTGTTTPAPAHDAARSGRVVALWHAVTGVLGAVAGLAPHVLHHVGLLAGTAVVTGAGGTALFGALGLALSVPMLRRLYRRFGTWRAPAIGLAVFAALFTLSATVIGPAINGDSAGTQSPSPTAPVSPGTGHDGHH